MNLSLSVALVGGFTSTTGVGIIHRTYQSHFEKLTQATDEPTLCICAFCCDIYIVSFFSCIYLSLSLFLIFFSFLHRFLLIDENYLFKRVAFNFYSFLSCPLSFFFF